MFLYLKQSNLCKNVFEYNNIAPYTIYYIPFRKHFDLHIYTITCTHILKIIVFLTTEKIFFSFFFFFAIIDKKNYYALEFEAPRPRPLPRPLP